jgi:hypothetical protein
MAGRASRLGPTVTATTWRFVALLCVAVLGGVDAGCSFVFTEGLPSEHAKLAYFDCTSTYGLSVADGLIALGSGIGAGTTLSQSKQAFSDKNSGASRNAAAGVDIVVAAVLAGSAVYGAVQATRCDRAKEELKARIFAAPLRPPSPPGLVPGTAPTFQPPPTPFAPPPSAPLPPPSAPPPATPPSPLPSAATPAP